jgi:uncharacterized protein DUF5670
MQTGDVKSTGGKFMLATIAIVLVALWLLGVVTAVTFNGFVHVLLVLAIVSILLHLFRGRPSAVRP